MENKMDGIKAVIGEDGVVRMYEEPFATIECATEEDFEYIKSAVEFHKKHKWIPVTERLPEEWEPVLVRSKFGFLEAAWYIGIGKWRYTANAVLFEEGSITHWMPLPDPPGISE
jgi:hypothetical protein